jgi:hypothetical protein
LARGEDEDRKPCDESPPDQRTRSSLDFRILGCGMIVSWSGGVDMEIVLLPLFYILPLIVGWVVVYTAVLAALRRHDRD